MPAEERGWYARVGWLIGLLGRAVGSRTTLLEGARRWQHPQQTTHQSASRAFSLAASTAPPASAVGTAGATASSPHARQQCAAQCTHLTGGSSEKRGPRCTEQGRDACWQKQSRMGLGGCSHGSKAKVGGGARGRKRPPSPLATRLSLPTTPRCLAALTNAAASLRVRVAGNSAGRGPCSCNARGGAARQEGALAYCILQRRGQSQAGGAQARPPRTRPAAHGQTLPADKRIAKLMCATHMGGVSPPVPAGCPAHPPPVARHLCAGGRPRRAAQARARSACDGEARTQG